MVHLLHERAIQCVQNYKHSELALIDVLTEIDRTKMYLQFGASSLFRYCTEKLSLSEPEAFRFIQVTRKAIEVPALKHAISNGVLTVSKASRIAPVITKQTQDEWIKKAATLTHREIEREVVKVNPKALCREKLESKTIEISELRLNISMELEKQLRRVQEVLKTKSLEETLEKVVEFTLKHKDPLLKAERRSISLQRRANIQKHEAPSTWKAQPQPKEESAEEASLPSRTSHPRYIPAPLTHLVNLRDKRRCQFRDCSETKWIELHHIKPLSHGGRHELSNLITLCSAHHSMMHGSMKANWLSLKGNNRRTNDR